MKSLITLLSLISFLCADAQNTNKFLDRDFWKSEPSVSLIKKTIEDGNEPTLKGTSSFDGVSSKLRL